MSVDGGPEPESNDEREVYAFFGLAAYFAQVLERGAINLAVGFKLSGHKRVTEAVVDELFAHFGERPFGQLLSAIGDSVSPDTSTQLRAALRLRNQLIHSFFYDRAEDFLSEPGRATMIADLRAAIREFQLADDAVERVTEDLWKKFGVAAEVVQKYSDAMQARAQEREEGRCGG